MFCYFTISSSQTACDEDYSRSVPTAKILTILRERAFDLEPITIRKLKLLVQRYRGYGRRVAFKSALELTNIRAINGFKTVRPMRKTRVIVVKINWAFSVVKVLTNPKQWNCKHFGSFGRL